MMYREYKDKWMSNNMTVEALSIYKKSKLLKVKNHPLKSHAEFWAG